MKKFSKSLYSQEAIKEAVKRYKEIADLQMAEKNKYYLVKIKPKKSEYNNFLEDEFGNYVLGLKKGAC